MSTETPQFGAWLGGCLETTGSLFFIEGKTVQKGKTYLYPAPTIALVDDNFDRMSRLPKIAGANLKKGSHNHWFWTTSGKKAASLALLAERYAPSRQEMILAVHNWENGDSDERLVIAREMKGTERITTVPPSTYESLITNPNFLAGVVDLKSYLRESFHTVSGHRYRDILIILHSRNRPLLLALSNNFGGTVGIQHDPNTQRDIFGKNISFQDESYIWRSESAKIQNLLRAIRGTSLLRKEEIDRLLANT